MPGRGLRQSQSLPIALDLRRRDGADSSRSRRCAPPPASTRSSTTACASVHERLLVQAAADARLVGDDHDGEAGVVQQADGVDRVREERPGARDDRGIRLLRAACRRDRGRRPALMRRAARRHRASRRRVDGVEHRVDADAAHAAVIDRTVSQHAGTAEHLMNDHVVIAERRGDPLVGRTEDRRDRHAGGRGQVHRARIVGHEGVTRREQPGKQPEIGPADQVDDAAPRSEAPILSHALHRGRRRRRPARTWRRRAVRRATTSATRSGGQRLAWPYAAPGASPTSGVERSTPSCARKASVRAACRRGDPDGGAPGQTGGRRPARRRDPARAPGAGSTRTGGPRCAAGQRPASAAAIAHARGSPSAAECRPGGRPTRCERSS